MKVLEKTTLKLTTQSPIHIGSVEQKLTPFEYILKDGYVYPVSENNLSEFLLKRGLINLYLSAIETQGHMFRIEDFFNQNGVKLDDSELLKLSNGKRVRISGNTSRLTEYRPFIRDGLGNVYLPGTAIKGVIRTAVLYCILKRYKESDPENFRKQIEERIDKTDIRFFKRRDTFLWLQEFYLQNFTLNNKKRSPNTDWFRVISVSDAYSERDFQTEIIGIKVLKKEKSGWQIKRLNKDRDMLIWAECVPEGVTFRFDICFDKNILEKFNDAKQNKFPQNIQELLNMIQEWARDIQKYEQKFFDGHPLSQWYQKELNFRIGFGSGMLSTTIALLLPEDLRKKIRNYSGKNRGNEIAPKSRRLWINNNKYIPLGWAKLDIT
jgi:CRISPR-associated protein Csm5